MRLPSGDWDGALPRAHVIKVLQDNDVTVTTRPDRYVISKGDFAEVQYFGEMIPRAVIHHLARRFDLDPFLFWYESYDEGPPE